MIILFSVFLMNWLDINLFERNTHGYWQMEGNYPPGTSLEFLKNQESLILDKFDSKNSRSYIFGRIGGEKNDIYYQADPDQSSSKLTLYFTSEEKYEDLIKWEETLADSFSGFFKLTSLSDPLPGLLGLNKPGNILIKAEDKDMVEGEIQFSPDETMEEIQLTPFRNRMSYFNINLTGLVSSLTSSLEGIFQGTMDKDGVEYPLHFRYGDIEEKDILRLKINSPQGELITFRDISSLERVESRGKILRVDKMDALWLEGQNDIQTLRNQVQILHSPQTLISRYQKEISINFFLSIIFLYLYLGIQYESLTQPLLTLLLLPPVILSGLALLSLLGKELTLQSAMGILILLGISINNSILLIDGFNKEMYNKLPVTWRILLSIDKRRNTMRSTTLTTIISLLPLAIRSSPQQGMAILVMGGLISSYVLSLYLLPGLYLASTKIKR